MTRRPMPEYDFKVFGVAIKTVRTRRKENHKKVSDEMLISSCCLTNIENRGQHSNLQIFLEFMLRYSTSIDQFLLETSSEKNMRRRQLDTPLDGINDTGTWVTSATAKEITEVETEGR